jgi:predicted transcriptional regulator
MKIEESIAERKIDLAQRLLAIDDLAVLDEIYAILVNAAEDDVNWYENLSDEDKASIERGRADIAAGRVISQKDLMAESKTWGKR